MGVIKGKFQAVRGTAYRFSHLHREKNSIGLVFQRRVGIFDDVSEEEAPETSIINLKCAYDMFVDDFGEHVSGYMEVDDVYVPIYPKEELQKACDKVSELPRDVLISDMTVQSYFRNPHAWPFKKWDYKGLSAIETSIKPS